MTIPLSNTKVFKPLKVGNFEVKHRIFHAPTTRLRCTDGHIPTDLQLQYYDDRSKVPGTLIITEAANVSSQFPTYFDYTAGIFNERQVQGWKIIVDKIHSNASFASCQICGAGRAANATTLRDEGEKFIVAPSPIYFSEESKREAEAVGVSIREFTESEIKDIVIDDHLKAAENAFKAGFDVVELHLAHGYLFDQFLQPSSNQRHDKYGGSIENRARVVLQLIDLLISRFGASKIAVRISPWAKTQGMKAEEDEVHPIVTFGYLLSELQRRADTGDQLAYVSIVEPRVQGYEDVALHKQFGDNSFVFQIWKGIVARTGNYTYDSPVYSQILNDVDSDRTLIGFSRYFTSNPDLVQRLKKGLELTDYDEDTFYTYNNYGYNTWGVYGSAEISSNSDESKKLPTPLI